MPHTNVKNAKTDRGFTLVEILVVIAISAVLFALLLDPLVNSFRLTQRAQMLAGAQDQARIRMENLTRELGSATYVFGNTTHPFGGTSGTTNASIPNLHFTNFLVLDTVKSDGTDTPAVVFNAKLDFVLPRHTAGSSNLTDPTTGQPISIQGNGTLRPTGLTFPLAPDTTMIRYFVGLRDPTKPYATRGEGPLLAGNGDNTYVLYRAEFPPTLTSGGTTTPNTNLFATTTNAQGQTVPEFDDPNFFRYVTTNDIDWLSPTHTNYGSAGAETVSAHNTRVDQWAQIAKPIIGLTNVDLILLPHNSDNSIYYDPSGLFQNISHSGAVHDPVTGTDWPVVNSSVTFRPASVSADATASTTSDNAGNGYGGDVAAVNGGLPYVPTVYTATDQSWAFPYHISLYPSTNTTGALFDTQVADQTVANMYAAGDLVEMYDSGTGNVPVYDVTSGTAIPSAQDPGVYVPMTVTPDTGTINFDMPALPTPTNPYQRYWSLPTADLTSPSQMSDFNTGRICSNGVVNLADNNLLPGTPLPVIASLGNNADGSTPAPSSVAVQNAHIVPGSLRIYGPDATPGPNQGYSVLYTQVTPGSSSFGPNEYTVDYVTNSITLYIDPQTGGFSALTKNGVNPPNNVPDPVQIAYDYQANAVPGAGAAPSVTNPYSPLRVKVDYQTRDLLDVSLGVRVYDPNNVGPAQIVTVHNQIRIGNSNR